ncbi:MAG: methyltransferase domain-containing protein [Rhodothermales bacterium]|nr:methyltransferase domain-containing protein [Rhodothermales bacterium]
MSARRSAALRRLYSLYAPFYDALLTRFTRPGRAASVRLAALQPGERVLIPGCGTGLDFAHLPKDVDLVAGDFAPPMVARARRAAERAGFDPEAVQTLDASRLPFPDASFDAVLLHLIVAVVPNPEAVVAEARRVLRPGGRLGLFDKFAPDDQPVAAWRQAVNPLLAFFVTDVTRQAGPLLRGAGFAKEADVPVRLNGLFRAIRAR